MLFCFLCESLCDLGVFVVNSSAAGCIVADLFDDMRAENRTLARPLAARMRPRTLDDFVGQQHFLGPGKLLRRMMLADRLNSLIFYGPPGSGKTALAHVIANHTKSRFKPLNAVASGTKEVREVLT